MAFIDTTIRVRYAETDRMGYVYYGNYAQYFEVARVEALRAGGMSYKDLEDSGIILPVASFDIQYKKPAFYDELLTIRTSLDHVPDKRIAFTYETLNEKGEQLNVAHTKLVFVSKETNRPIDCPAALKEKLAKVFEL